MGRIDALGSPFRNYIVNESVPGNDERVHYGSWFGIWLYYCISSMKRELERRAASSTFAEISRDNVRSLPVLLPPVAEQRAIADVLDSIDEAIERTEAVIAATETLRDSLLHELLTRGVPGWHSECKNVPGIGAIPADWEVVRLGEAAEVNSSTWNPDDGAEILYLDLTAVIAPGALSAPKPIAAVDAPSRARRRVKSGAILVSTVRPNLRGFARMPQAPDNLVASTGFAVLTPRVNVDGSYIYQHVMAQGFADFLDGATTGQAYPAVRPSDIARLCDAHATHRRAASHICYTGQRGRIGVPSPGRARCATIVERIYRRCPADGASSGNTSERSSQ